MHNPGTHVAVLSNVFKVCGPHQEINGQSHVFRQMVSSAFSVALFQIFRGLDGV